MEQTSKDRAGLPRSLGAGPCGPSPTRMLKVRHAARVSITSTPTCARCSGAVTRAWGKRCDAPVPSRTISGDVCNRRSKSTSDSASNPFGANPDVTESAVSTMLSRYSMAPMRTQPGPVPVTMFDADVCRWNFTIVRCGKLVNSLGL